MPRNCGQCHFFEPIIVFEHTAEDAQGDPTTICRRFPPTDGWPSVLADDWCGEWKERRP